jgi:hypothetical protein
VNLKPSASLYGGTYGGDITVTVQNDAARIVIQLLDDVDLVPLGRDLLGTADIAGTGAVSSTSPQTARTSAGAPRPAARLPST